MDVNGKNQQNVLTGQVPVGDTAPVAPPGTPVQCIQHRPKAHDAEGSDEIRWCPNCGRNDADEQKAPANGGWGT
jgi:hypothetical protein